MVIIVHIYEVHKGAEDDLHVADRDALVEGLESVAAFQGVEVGVARKESLTKVKEEDHYNCQQPTIQHTCCISQK